MAIKPSILAGYIFFCMTSYAAASEQAKTRNTVPRLTEACAEVLVRALLTQKLSQTHILANTLTPDFQGLLIQTLNNHHRCELLKCFTTSTELNGHTEYIRHIAWRPDGKYALSCSDDCTIRLWDCQNINIDVVTARVLNGHTQYIMQIAWSHDGQYALSSGGDGVRRWDFRDMANVTSRIVMNSQNLAAAMMWNPRNLSALFVIDGRLRMYDEHDLVTEVIPTLGGETREVNSASWSHCGNYILSGNADKTVVLWDVSNPRTPQLNVVLADNAMETISCSPHGKYALAASPDQLFLVNFDKKDIRICPIACPIRRIKFISWRYDGKYALVANDYSASRSVVLLNLANREEIVLYELKGHTEYVSSVGWSPCGSYALSGSRDGTMRVWNVSNLQRISSVALPGHDDSVHVAWHPNGAYALTGSLDKTLRIWNIDPFSPFTLAQGILLLKLILTQDNQNCIDIKNDPDIEKEYMTLPDDIKRLENIKRMLSVNQSLVSTDIRQSILNACNEFLGSIKQRFTR